MATIYTTTLLSYSTISGMSTGESKTVLLVAPHAYTSSVNRGYILGYDGSSVVDFYNNSSTAFADFDEIQTAVDSAASNSNLKWTLTKTSSGYTLTVNGYNPRATSNTTATWSTTTVTWTITNETSTSWTTGASSNDGITSGYTAASMLRLHPSTISSTSYLNQGGYASALKFAAGTGGWSVWNMYEVTETTGVTTYDVDITYNSSYCNLTSPSTNPKTVSSGDDLEISFEPIEDSVFQSMTVNDVEVTPTPTYSVPTYTYSTNYSTYSGSLANVFDNDDTTYVWTAEAPSAGKYVLVTFDQEVDLTEVYVYFNSATDILGSESVLQCSTDGNSWTNLGTFGSQSMTFSNLTATGIKYLRIYANSSNSYWVQLSTINMTYTATDTSSMTVGSYTYTLSNITEAKSVVITFGSGEFLYTKNSDGEWVVGKAYIKRGNCWWEASKSDVQSILSDKTILKKDYDGYYTNDAYRNKRTLIFEDDFNGNALDTSIWTPEIGFVRNNTALAYYSEDAISIEDSCMVFTATRTSGLPTGKSDSSGSSTWQLTWKSASVQTMDKLIPKFGRIEAKMKLPNLVGSFPSFWMLGNTRRIGEYRTDGYKPDFDESGERSAWSECGEIDIFEQYPGNSSNIYTNIWKTDGNDSSYQNSTYAVDTTEWHVYGIEWTSSTITWYVDDNVVDTCDISTADALYSYRNLNHFILISLQMGSSGGTPSSSVNEMKMYTDWVRIYDYERAITLTYTDFDSNNFRNYQGTYVSSPSTSETLTQGTSYESTLVAVCGKDFDTMTITMGDEDITDSVYNASLKKISIPTITDSVTITATTKDVSGKSYTPVSACPSGYASHTITSSDTFELPTAWTINVWADNGCTVFNIILPDDAVFDTDHLPIMPEELNFQNDVINSGKTSFGVLNDAGAVGITPLWQYSSWESTTRIAIQLPDSVLGTTVEEVQAWCDANPITFYYYTGN